MKVTMDQMVRGERYRVTYKTGAQTTTTGPLSFRERDNSTGMLVFEPEKEGQDPYGIGVALFVEAATVDE